MKNTITQLVKNPDEANEQGEENKSPGHANHIQARQLKALYDFTPLRATEEEKEE